MYNLLLMMTFFHNIHLCSWVWVRFHKITRYVNLKPNAQPYALCTPRYIPLALRQKVQMELQHMEALGVISHVKEPTAWCAAIVVVPKPLGAVRICVDMKSLNENVLRETHPMSKIDTTLAQLTGATMFSKLDANIGFWQIPLTIQSLDF